MKCCIHCNVEKPLTDFNADKRNADGRTSMCKSCRKIYIGAWREARRPPKKVRVIPAVKTCRDCHIEKPLGDFPKNSAQCKPCKRTYLAEWRRANPEKIKANSAKLKTREVILPEGITKSCKSCRVEKLLSEFPIGRGNKLGVRSKCKVCEVAAQLADPKNAERNERWRKTHPESVAASGKRSYRKHRAKRLEARKIWRANNLEKDKAREKRYASGNPHIGRLKNAQRRAAETKAVPKWLNWLDKLFIREIYDVAIARTMQTGVRQHVDHKIPLRGVDPDTGEHVVCGLHVPSNLQVLTETENCSKHNKFIEVAN